MSKYKMDRKQLNILKVILLIATNCIMIILNYLLYYICDRFFENYVPDIVSVILTAVLIIMYVVFAYYILPKWFSSVYYEITADEITLRSGVFFKSETYVKISSVQYETKIKISLLRCIDMNFLLINIYGGRRVIWFLSVEDVDEFYKKICKYLSDRGGL